MQIVTSPERKNNPAGILGGGLNKKPIIENS
jgi:hypothetical protein